MELNSQKNNYLYATILIVSAVLLTILLAVLVIRPIYIGNQNLSKDVNNKKEELAALEDKLEKLKNYEKEKEKLLEQKKKVLSALPEDKDIPRLFIQFENMISNTGGSVISASGSSSATSSTSQDGETSLAGINSYNYSLSVSTSTYESLKNTLLNTESALRLVGIDSLVIAKSDNSFDVSIGLKAYARTEESNEN